MARRGLKITALAILVMLLGTAPVVASDQDVFTKLVEKVAPEFFFFPGQKFKPKVACSCPNDGTSAKPGFVLTDATGIVRCGLPAFDAAGTVTALTFCSGFAVLGH